MVRVDTGVGASAVRVVFIEMRQEVKKVPSAASYGQ